MEPPAESPASVESNRDVRAQTGSGASREAEDRIRLLAHMVQSSREMVSIADLDDRFTFVNKAFLEGYGYTLDEVLGRRPDLVDSPDNPPGIRRAIIEETEKGGWTGELLNRRKDGTDFPISLSTSRIRNEEGVVIGLVGIARDITERRRAEEALRESEERYRLVFEANPQAMWVYDTETLSFLAVNDAAVLQYGYSRDEFLSMTIQDIRPLEDVPLLLRSVARVVRGIDRASRFRHRKKDGSLIDVEITSHLIQFGGRRGELVLASDVTEQNRLEEQLRQAQKMEAVGRLAGGVAHDFNNLLTAIIGYAELTDAALLPNDGLRDNIAEIRKAAERATSLTRQLLAFSRRQVLQPRILDLNQIVEELTPMLRRLIGEDVELVTRLGTGLPPVEVDPGQIHQVLMNLAVNARDAMPDGGRLTIETGKADVPEGNVPAADGLVPGRWVTLVIEDTGAGMDASTMAHLFEPFFTTKEVGKGTGLGLSTVYGIVKQSGGHVSVQTQPGSGTTFRIVFPPVEGAPDPSRGNIPEARLRKGTETILVVEDEEAVRRLISLSLKEHGYRVLSAASADEALRYCETLGEGIDLMLTDVVMPRMGGRELARRAAATRPKMKVLFMSGYTDDTGVLRSVVEAGVPFLQKPFSPADLVRKVREVLNAAPARQEGGASGR